MSYFNSAILCCFIIITSALAQADQNLSLSADKHLQIRYINHSWNQDPSKVDKGTIVVRNAETGRIVTLELMESQSDSGIFGGVFRIRTVQPENFVPQIYIPDNAGDGSQNLSSIQRQISKKQISRKPYFLRKDDKNFDILQIYDQKEEALAAYDAFQERFKTQQSLAQETLKAAQVAKDAKLQQIILEKQKAAQAKEEQRKALAVAEKQRQEELRKQHLALTQQQKQERKNRAMDLAKRAMQAYEANDFTTAKSLFRKSSELDPENNRYNFQYGVALYKLGEYNQSLVMLQMADGPQVDPLEKTYYIGLNYLKLEDFDQALKSFRTVQRSKAPKISPAAAFYSGVIQFQSSELDEARDSFQYVLDNSQDPALDRQAETYIEQIGQLKQYEEMSKKKFLASASFGLNYDSNILLSDDSTPDQGTATDRAGYRSLFTGDFAYRPILKPNYELLIKLGLTNMYTVDTSFKPNETLQAADPLQLNIGTPFTWRTMIGETPYQLTLTPGYETLAMNLDDVDNGLDGRETILNSTVLATDHTFVMSGIYITALQLGVRSDDSQVSYIDASDNADAIKINLMSFHTFFLNEEKSRAWTGQIGFARNDAIGDNHSFNRMEAGITYLTPTFWESVATTNFTYYQATYPDHSSNRKESNYSLSAGLSKPLTSTLTSSYQFSYTANESNISGGDYQKVSLMALLRWNEAF